MERPIRRYLPPGEPPSKSVGEGTLLSRVAALERAMDALLAAQVGCCACLLGCAVRAEVSGVLCLLLGHLGEAEPQLVLQFGGLGWERAEKGRGAAGGAGGQGPAAGMSCLLGCLS